MIIFHTGKDQVVKGFAKAVKGYRNSQESVRLFVRIKTMELSISRVGKEVIIPSKIGGASQLCVFPITERGSVLIRRLAGL